MKSFKVTVIGSVYLVLNWFRQLTLRAITSIEGGRVLVASLTQLEATRASELQGQRSDEKPISSDLYESLLAEDDFIVDSVDHERLSVLREYVSQGRGGVAVVISERGGGKSFLLKRLAMESSNFKSIMGYIFLEFFLIGPVFVACQYRY